jgi:hypothetical protein
MTREQGGFLILMLIAEMLIVMGIQGSLGIFVAVLFSPSHVQISEGDTTA